MGLDQLIKFIWKDDNKDGEDFCEGKYFEYYFRKNYFLSGNAPNYCYAYDILNEDNCINFTVNEKIFMELYNEALTELERIKHNKTSKYDYEDIEWVEYDLRQVVKMFTKYFELTKKYGEPAEIIYWQWY